MGEVQEERGRKVAKKGRTERQRRYANKIKEQQVIQMGRRMRKRRRGMRSRVGVGEPPLVLIKETLS